MMRVFSALAFLLAFATPAAAQTYPGQQPIPSVSGPAASGYVPVATGPSTAKWLQYLGVPVLAFPGVVCDGVNDDTNGINAALASGNSTANLIMLPSGTCKLSGPIVMQGGAGQVPHLRGAGRNNTYILQTCATCDGIQNLQAAAQSGGSIRSLSLHAGTATFQTAGYSSGVGINLKNVNGSFIVDDVWVSNFATSYKDDGSFNLFVSNFEFYYFQTTGISLPVRTTGGAVANGSFFGPGVVSNVGFTGTNTSSIGINIAESGGVYFRSMDVLAANNGVVINPASTKTAAFIFFTDVLADTSTSDNWVIDGTNGTISSVHCTQCWGAFSTNGSGLVTKGANLSDFTWTGGFLRENGQNGWHHMGGSNVFLNGASIAQNSKSVTNTFDGVLIDAGLSNWGIMNSRSGNYASGLGTTQANGLTIASSSSTNNFIVANNNFNNMGAGKSAVSLGALGTSYQMLGNLPAGNGINQSAAQVLTATTGNTTLAINTTNFLGPQSPTTTSGVNEFLADRPGTISLLNVQSSSAPGTSQTYTYTVEKNGADTTMTCAISGASSFACNTTSNAVGLAQGDRISLKVVTSATATAGFHRASMSLVP